MDRPSAETDALRPVDMYQATKGAATLLCQGYARQHGLDVCVARPYSVYGPHERPRRLFPRLVRAFGEGEAMTLFEGFHDFIHGAHGCHRGTVLTRPPVDDFGRGIDLLLAAGRQPGSVYNFGSGACAEGGLRASKSESESESERERARCDKAHRCRSHTLARSPGVQTSNFEVLRLFEQAAGRPAPAVERKEALAKAFESTVWVCNTEHSRATLGFEARVGLADGIKALLLAGTPQQPGVAP